MRADWLGRLPIPGNLRRRICIVAPTACGGRGSLVGRLLGLLFLGAIAVYAIVNIGLWWSSSRLLADSLEKQAVKWAAELDELGTPHYAGRNRSPLMVIEQRIRNFPEIAFVRYYDAPNARLIAEYGRSEPDIAPPATVQIEAIRDRLDTDEPYLIDRPGLSGGYLRVLAPVLVKSIRSDGLFGFQLDGGRAEHARVVGYLDIGVDTGYYRDELVKSIVAGSVVIAALFVLAFLAGRRMIRRALAPLTELQAPLARLANGEVDVVVQSEGDEEIAAIGTALNATIRSLRQRDEQLRRMAERDGLTGLVNRGQFGKVLEQELARLREQGGGSALYFIDLDHFKYVNDTLGHAAGDRLLVLVAEALHTRLREHDVVARFGGDEFMVLVRDVSRQAALDIGRSLNAVVAGIHLVEGDQQIGAGASIGVTLLGPGDATVEHVVAQADIACFAAKSGGRSRCQLYEPSDEEKLRMTNDIGWSQRIKRALRGDEFRLFYQPIRGVRPGGGEYYEALLRLPEPGGELLMPAVLLPVAQRFGLMVDVDRWVVANAIAALGGLRKNGRTVTFSINLSGESFEDPSLLTLVCEQLERHGVPGSAIVFEITEQTAVRYIEKARDLIDGLIALGCRFALDDFGSGFSSFSYLKHLPVDFIKIDGAFIQNLSSDSVDQAMVGSIIDIARALGKQTIAEFVQDEHAIELLRARGIDFVQGYYVGQPAEHLPAGQINAAA